MVTFRNDDVYRRWSIQKQNRKKIETGTNSAVKICKFCQIGGNDDLPVLTSFLRFQLLVSCLLKVTLDCLQHVFLAFLIKRVRHSRNDFDFHIFEKARFFSQFLESLDRTF